jgi:chromosome segregation ATPase
MDRETVDEIKRHFGVLIEGVESKLQVVAEGVALANERIDRLNERIDRLDQRMDRLEQRMDRLETEVHQGFSELRAMIKLSYEEIDRRLMSLESAYEGLARRVLQLEAKLAS